MGRPSLWAGLCKTVQPALTVRSRSWATFRFSAKRSRASTRVQIAPSSSSFSRLGSSTIWRAKSRSSTRRNSRSKLLFVTPGAHDLPDLQSSAGRRHLDDRQGDGTDVEKISDEQVLV